MLRSSLLTAALLFSLPFAMPAQETRYTPPGGIKPLKGKVDIESIRLLVAQELFDRNVSAEKLAAFIKQIQDSVTRSVPLKAPAFDLLVRVTMSATTRPSYELSSQGNPPKQILEAIYDNLQKLSDARSKTDSLPFEIHFVIMRKP